VGDTVAGGGSRTVPTVSIIVISLVDATFHQPEGVEVETVNICTASYEIPVVRHGCSFKHRYSYERLISRLVE